MADERFSLWLSMAARDRPIRARIVPELGRAGYWRQFGAQSGFTGARIGRGAGVGRVLASSASPGDGFIRRVATDTRIVRLQRGYPSSAVKAHLRYLVRSRADVDRRPVLYGADGDARDIAAFARRCREDRHQFRTVVAAEDACEYEDLRPLVRRLMKQVARDLRTNLDWVAADHYNTANPHSHIAIRGVDERGDDLIIAREYINHGLRRRASELVALDLGRTRDLAIERANERRLSISQEQITGIDRDLVAARDWQGKVSSDHPDRWEQAARAGRLRVLGTLGLAHEDENGRWLLQPDLLERLEEVEWRNRMARSRDRVGVDRFEAWEGGRVCECEQALIRSGDADDARRMSEHSLFAIDGLDLSIHDLEIAGLVPPKQTTPSAVSGGPSAPTKRLQLDQSGRGLGRDWPISSDQSVELNLSPVGSDHVMSIVHPVRRSLDGLEPCRDMD